MRAGAGPQPVPSPPRLSAHIRLWPDVPEAAAGGRGACGGAGHFRSHGTRTGERGCFLVAVSPAVQLATTSVASTVSAGLGTDSSAQGDRMRRSRVSFRGW